MEAGADILETNTFNANKPLLWPTTKMESLAKKLTMLLRTGSLRSGR
ncbi:hypothetical protein O9992_10900 [Vibrio lentus]|nr:hypothetical protein [Vibrio lentus]